MIKQMHWPMREPRAQTMYCGGMTHYCDGWEVCLLERILYYLGVSMDLQRLRALVLARCWKCSLRMRELEYCCANYVVHFHAATVTRLSEWLPRCWLLCCWISALLWRIRGTLDGRGHGISAQMKTYIIGVLPVFAMGYACGYEIWECVLGYPWYGFGRPGWLLYSTLILSLTHVRVYHMHFRLPQGLLCLDNPWYDAKLNLGTNYDVRVSIHIVFRVPWYLFRHHLVCLSLNATFSKRLTCVRVYTSKAHFRLPLVLLRLDNLKFAVLNPDTKPDISFRLTLVSVCLDNPWLILSSTSISLLGYYSAAVSWIVLLLWCQLHVVGQIQEKGLKFSIPVQIICCLSCLLALWEAVCFTTSIYRAVQNCAYYHDRNGLGYYHAHYRDIAFTVPRYLFGLPLVCLSLNSTFTKFLDCLYALNAHFRLPLVLRLDSPWFAVLNLNTKTDMRFGLTLVFLCLDNPWLMLSSTSMSLLGCVCRSSVHSSARGARSVLGQGLSARVTKFNWPSLLSIIISFHSYHLVLGITGSVFVWLEVQRIVNVSLTVFVTTSSCGLDSKCWDRPLRFLWNCLRAGGNSSVFGMWLRSYNNNNNSTVSWSVVLLWCLLHVVGQKQEQGLKFSISLQIICCVSCLQALWEAVCFTTSIYRAVQNCAYYHGRFGLGYYHALYHDGYCLYHYHGFFNDTTVTFTVFAVDTHCRGWCLARMLKTYHWMFVNSTVKRSTTCNCCDYHYHEWVGVVHYHALLKSLMMPSCCERSFLKPCNHYHDRSCYGHYHAHELLIVVCTCRQDYHVVFGCKNYHGKLGDICNCVFYTKIVVSIMHGLPRSNASRRFTRTRVTTSIPPTPIFPCLQILSLALGTLIPVNLWRSLTLESWSWLFTDGEQRWSGQQVLMSVSLVLGWAHFVMVLRKWILILWNCSNNKELAMRVWRTSCSIGVILLLYWRELPPRLFVAQPLWMEALAVTVTRNNCSIGGLPVFARDYACKYVIWECTLDYPWYCHCWFGRPGMLWYSTSIQSLTPVRVYHRHFRLPLVPLCLDNPWFVTKTKLATNHDVDVSIHIVFWVPRYLFAQLLVTSLLNSTFTKCFICVRVYILDTHFRLPLVLCLENPWFVTELHLDTNHDVRASLHVVFRVPRYLFGKPLVKLLVNSTFNKCLTCARVYSWNARFRLPLVSLRLDHLWRAALNLEFKPELRFGPTLVSLRLDYPWWLPCPTSILSLTCEFAQPLIFNVLKLLQFDKRSFVIARLLHGPSNS